MTGLAYFVITFGTVMLEIDYLFFTNLTFGRLGMLNE